MEKPLELWDAKDKIKPMEIWDSKGILVIILLVEKI